LEENKIFYFKYYYLSGILEENKIIYFKLLFIWHFGRKQNILF